MPITPGQALTFDESDRESIGAYVTEAINELEQSHEEMFSDISEQWEHYDAEPLVETRSEPYLNASNVVIPTVAIYANGTIARYMQLISASPDIWTGRSDNEEFVKAGYAREVTRFLNWSARNEYDFYGPVTDWVNEIVICGSSVLHLKWQTDTRTVFLPTKGKSGKVEKVIVKRGPILEHIPRERSLWDINYAAWGSPIIARQSFLSWPDVLMRANTDGWDQKLVTEIKGQTVGNYSDSKAAEIHAEKAKRSGVDLTQSMLMNAYDWREVWLAWPVAKGAIKADGPNEMEADDDLATIVAFVHRPSGRVAKITAKPYGLPDNPFYDAYFKKRTGQNTSRGLGRSLRDFQAGQTALMNQAIDVVNISNSLPGFTTDPRLANAKLKLGKWQLISDKEAFIPANLSKLISPDIAMFTQLKVLAEQLTGVNDPALGRETRMGGHPAPATSTLQLLQQGKQLDIIAMASIRRALARMALDKASLYQQMEVNDEKIVRAVGKKDAVAVQTWMFPTDIPILGNLELDLAAVDTVMNPQVEQQKYLLVFQATANFYALVLQHLQVAANPQIPAAVRSVGLQAIEGLSEAFSKIIESNDIDNIEAFTFDLGKLAAGIQSAGGAQPGGAPPGGPGQPTMGRGNGGVPGSPGVPSPAAGGGGLG